ncbi:response regulator [candidate division KSB3 bacterium]|uniref:Response regulator n=1 Tax=candidate division KSB3 bacterium TaxID=2044937 RepID=A0A9D5JW13_9BACT|nr:response regulator [candidate division KSB3 bacterium]MBD3324981.1 response regulator [candidate division KSB3 bacterium]
MTKSVLIVDDSAVIRDSLGFLLETEGFTVQTAENGLEGLEKLQTHQFDTIIADINMPQMHGYDLIRAIRQYEQYRDVPIIILTTEEEARDKKQGFEAGANLFLIKPTDPKKMIKYVKMFLHD